MSDASVGKVHGGDRLPWVQAAGSNDNFTPLASLAWQIHSDGAADAGLADWCASQQLQLERFEWNASFESAGLMQNAVYLIRPDGYVAFADSKFCAQSLSRFLRRSAVQRAASP
jgi:hypothetical protein